MGEEFAVDAYFNNLGNPVVLNIFQLHFNSENDVKDILYSTNKLIYDKYLKFIN